MDQIQQIMKAAEKAQKEVQKVENELNTMRIEHKDEGVSCTVSGSGAVISIEISETLCQTSDHLTLSSAVTQCIQGALKKAEKVATKKMNDIKKIMTSSGLM